MEIKATLTIQLHPDTLAVIEGLLGKVNGHPVSVEKPSANGKAKETKVVQMDPPAETKATDVTEVIKKTITEIRALVQKKSTAGKKDQVKTLLAEFGADKVTNLQEKDYSGFYSKVEAL